MICREMIVCHLLKHDLHPESATSSRHVTNRVFGDGQAMEVILRAAIGPLATFPHFMEESRRVFLSIVPIAIRTTFKLEPLVNLPNLGLPEIEAAKLSLTHWDRIRHLCVVFRPIDYEAKELESWASYPVDLITGVRAITRRLEYIGLSGVLPNLISLTVDVRVSDFFKSRRYQPTLLEYFLEAVTVTLCKLRLRQSRITLSVLSHTAPPHDYQSSDMEAVPESDVAQTLAGQTEFFHVVGAWV